MYRFAAACDNESILFGAARPGSSDQQILEWIQFMQQHNIRRVCCLLPKKQLQPYTDLLNTYRQCFGTDRALWAPIDDFHLCDCPTLTQHILPFLKTADQTGESVVIHCSGGIGRTGHILAAGLVALRGLSNQVAIAAVRHTGRNPYEAAIAAPLRGQNPLGVIRELNELLDTARAFSRLS